MRRRQFLGGLGSAALAWPLAARAQQGERIRTIGLLVASTADDLETKTRVMAFRQALEQLGWIDGRNARFDIRWATTNADALRKQAAELAAVAPDVILAASGTTTTAPFTGGDPHCADRVRGCHRPGRCRLWHEPGAAGWQRYRLPCVRIWSEREMVGAAQADCAWR
jgi:hypothetical protein